MQNILQKSNLLGIDINDTSVRIIELKKTKTEYQVIAKAITPYPQISDIEPTDAVIIAALKTAIKQAACKTTNAAIALSHSAIISKTIKIAAALPENQLEDFLKLNCEKFIGEPEDKISLDFELLTRQPDANQQIDLQLIAVRRERVNRCLQILTASGLTPKVIDIDSHALERFVRCHCPKLTASTVCINIESKSILLIALNATQIIYAQKYFYQLNELITPAQIMQQMQKVLQLCLSTLHQPLSQIILSGEKIIPENLLKNLSIPTITTKLSPFAISFGLALRTLENI